MVRRHGADFYIVDTNVLSELMKAYPDPAVLFWFRSQPKGRMFVTIFNVAELWHGVHLLDRGHRRDDLIESLGKLLRDFEGRVLQFERKAARAYARSAPRFRNIPPAPGPEARTPDVFERVEDLRRDRDRGLAAIDLMIASIAISRGFVVATRNVKHFARTQAKVVNPWEA